MRLLLNILWVIFGGGFVIWLEYMLGGLLLCLTIVGIPFGVQCFKLAGLGLLPFGKDIIDTPGASPIGCVLNVFWLLTAGVWIFLSHLGLALGLAVTIIGIPFAIQHVKLALLALAPFGKRVRET
ncbi:MAG: YccF domain-containing protein [Archangium sp.]